MECDCKTKRMHKLFGWRSSKTPVDVEVPPERSTKEFIILEAKYENRSFLCLLIYSIKPSFLDTEM